MLAPVRRQFRALALAFVPETGSLPPEGWMALEQVVEDALRARPRSLRRQALLLIHLIDWCAILRFGRGVGRLEANHTSRLLRTLESAPVLLLRRGIWGLRTLIQMGYYTQPSIQRAIGYRGHSAGWEARR